MGSEERWLKITTSYNAMNAPNKYDPQKISVKPPSTVKLNEVFLDHPSHSKSRLPDLELFDDPLNQNSHDAIKRLAAKVQKLEALLEEKSKIIQRQEKMIIALKTQFESCGCNVVEEESVCPTVMKESRSVPNCAIKRSEAKNDKAILQQILKSVDELESRMSKMATSLPNKMNQLIIQFMSNCKFQWEESEIGECLLIVKQDENPSSKPIWSKPPTIRPRPNNSSKMRLGSQPNAHNQYADHVQTPISDNVLAHLQRLETVVGELKVNFIQLLVDKLTIEKKRQKSKNSSSNISDKTGCSRFPNLFKTF